MHKYVLPNEELSPYVRRFFEIDIPHASTFDDNRIVPMGTGIIVFIVKGNPRIENIKGIFNYPDYGLSGQCFPTYSFACDTPLQFYGIVLKPTATLKLFDVCLADLKNDFMVLDEVIGNRAEQTLQKLRQVDSTEDRFSILSDLMMEMLPPTVQYTHLDVLVDLIFQKQGILKVKELCEHEDVSRRYLEKRFKKVIGFTPGQFIRQVRFDFTCAEIAEGSSPVGDILVKYGYFDRSHFMKKFKKHFGADLDVLAGDKENLFKIVFSRIMRSEEENRFHP